MSSPRHHHLVSIAALLISCTVAWSCSDDVAESDALRDADDLFSARVTQVTLEVDYQEGATPYTELPLRPGNPWDLTRSNLEALFEQAPRELVVPDELAQMEELPGVDSGPDFTTAEILALAQAHRQGRSTPTARTFYVVFLDGYFTDEEGRQAGVLGVSLGDTGVIALFKPVIDATASPRFVEQTTLVHELGHAVGLVANGLEPVTDHRDAEHGAHCDNEDCVMYWQNEGAAGLLDFVRRYVTDSDAIVFGAACLADAHAASQP